MIRYFVLGITLILSSATCLSQEVSNENFPSNVVRDWRILPDTIFRGVLSLDQRPYADDMTYGDRITLVSEDGSNEQRLALDEIHPEDAAWIEFASTWAGLSRNPKRLPDPENVEVWTKAIERERFPRIGFESLPPDIPGIRYFFACYASWWDKTGFLPSGRGEKTAQWAFDLSKELPSMKLRGLYHHYFSSFMRKAYGANTRLSVATVPWVDTSILSHYSNSNDLLLLRVLFSRGGIIDDTTRQEPIFIAIAAADLSGTVHFLYDENMVRSKLVAVDESTTLPGLVPGAMELVISNRENAGRFFESPYVRVFINPTDINPLWVFRPYRTIGVQADSKKEYLIPPPPVEGFDGSSIAGLPATVPLVPPEPVIEKREPFEFKENHFPRQFNFQQARAFQPREWTSSDGKKITAAYTGKIDGFPISRSVINRGGREMQIAPDQLSPFDRAYLTMMNADAGRAAVVEQSGRILCRITSDADEVPFWLELKFSKAAATAVTQQGAAYTPVHFDGKIPSAEELLKSETNVFKIDWVSQGYEDALGVPLENPIGSIDGMSIFSVRRMTKAPGGLARMTAQSLPGEHNGLPVRVLSLPLSEDGVKVSLKCSPLRLPWLTGFWKVFSERSNSRLAKAIEPAASVFDDLHQAGLSA